MNKEKLLTKVLHSTREQQNKFNNMIPTTAPFMV